MAKAKKSVSAYERVKQILNEIQGDCVPEYQGHRAFWLSIDTFLSVELYGQRMISPALDEDKNSAAESSGATGGGCCGGKLSNAESASDSDKATVSDTGDDSDQSGGAAVDAVNLEPHGEVQADCWPSGGHSGGTAGGNQKRSDRSGIIIGLRGQYPFDDSLFPPLLWNAKRRATDAEIQLIANWIDSGCPTDEAHAQSQSTQATQVQAGSSDIIALACGDKAHKVSGKCTNIDNHATKGLHVRKEVSTLTQTELERLRNALACMYQYNNHWLDERSFDYWARIHTNSCQHGWEQFLPWHRLYLYFFEQTLQDYDEYISLPYWAWSDYASENAKTFNTLQLDQGIIPKPYRCWLTQEGYKRLSDSGYFDEQQLSHLEKLAKSGKDFNSGQRFLNAAQIEYTLEKNAQTGKAQWGNQVRAIYNELRRANPLWFPNRWPGSVASPTHYPTVDNINLLLSISNWSDFAGGPEYDHHFGKLEEVHNGMHNFSGGKNPKHDMYIKAGIKDPDPQNFENPLYGWMTDNRVTAYDPIFWAHHSNVDRLWARWQELHPDVKPEDMDGVLAPWSLTIKDSMSIKKLGYEYMRDSFYYKTHNQKAITIFNSDKAGVRSDVLDTYRKAELRLHRVQLGNKFNTTVRMFLNQPDACAETSIVDNEHYVGDITTFHGSCYGGSGHCNLPLDKVRNTDHRRLHHHEPRNFRVDATDAVNRMLAKGEDDLSVHLVAVGIDGKPIDDALFIDGVSLNFID